MSEEKIIIDSEEREKQDIYHMLERTIIASDLTPEQKRKQIEQVAKMMKKKVDILLVGATAVGKSSTICALFKTENAVHSEVAPIGVGVDPETSRMESYKLQNLTLWDSPGLGDSNEADKKCMELIKEKLNERDTSGNALIDLVLVILDAASKDLGTTYDCINNVLVPVLGREEASKRILVAINQADMGLKGRHWNQELNSPDLVLTEYLDRKVDSVARRLFESTGIRFEPVYYAAGYKEPGQEQREPYNLTKLLMMIINAIPKEKRMVIANAMNPDREHWKYTDGRKDYGTEVLRSLWETVKDTAWEYADRGIEYGIWIAGAPGGVLGGIIGAVIGSVVGALKYASGNN